MTPTELRALPEAPPLGAAVQALWWAARGEWDRAHESAQSGAGREADWVHAYLHRVEGDPENAGYWYSRAGKPFPAEDLDAEWQAIAADLLGQAPAHPP